jgi:RNA polymerase sigma-70 factor (ECF subfamily)
VIHSRLHTVQHPEALASWIYCVVRRTVSNHRRSRRTRSAARSTVDGNDLESHEPTPFQVTQRNAGRELLARLLSKLDEPKREVFALVELEEMTAPEVAAALGIPLNTVYTRLRAARQAFDVAVGRHHLLARGSSRRVRNDASRVAR